MTALHTSPCSPAPRARSLSLWLLLLLASLAGAAPLAITMPLLNGSLDAPYILESDPAHNGLRISTSARVVRNRIAPAADVTVRWRATLSQNGTTVAQATKTTQHSIPGVYDDFISTGMELDPPGLLSDTLTYSLLLEVHYINDSAGGVPFTAGDTDTIVLTHFGHFSGVVNFGTQAGTLTSFGAPAPQYVVASSSWQVAAFAGTLSNGLPIANSTNSTALSVSRNTATGDLTVNSGSAEIDDGNGQFTWNAWSGVRGPVVIQKTGIKALNFRLTLPAGVGWRDGTTGVLRNIFRSENVELPLTLALQPIAGSVTGAIPAGREFVGAALPVAFTPPTFKFDGTTLVLNTPGTRFLRQNRYTQEVALSGKLPRSNDSYFRFLQATAASDLELRHGGSGPMTVTLRTNAGDYTTHFPDGDVGGLASSLRVMNDNVAPAFSSMQASWVHLQYGKGCPQSGGHFPQGMRILAPVLTATPQGGITATGSLATNAQFGGVERHLEVGRNSNGLPVHQTDEFNTAGFYAPGFSTFLTNSPAEVLLAEIKPSAGNALGLPGTAPYAEGLGLYAGFNFEYPNAMHVRSRTGGAAPMNYQVTARRAYARWSGVSGVIQAEGAALPFQQEIYGFPIGFTDWAFNFLSNEMRQSFIESQVDLTQTPAGFTQGMENVRISCCGNLEGFDIPEGEENKRLSHWQDFEIANSSARFVTPGCDNNEAVLAYATTVHINGLPGRKAGRIAFRSNGHPTIPTDSLWALAPSFLSLEPQSGVAAQYRWWPRGDAYFSNPGGQPEGTGFVTAAGDVETPFFTISTVRLHTTAVPEVDDEVLVGFIQGDFLAPGAEDTTHGGMPGMSVDDYRNDVSFRPVAKASFFGVELPWEFPVVYHDLTGNFHSPDDVEVNLWISKFHGRISRLNAELAHVRFGQEIENPVQMDVGSLVEEAADYGAQGLAEAIGGAVTGPVKDALLAMAETLDNKLERLLQEALDKALEETAGELLTELRGMAPNWDDPEISIVLNNHTPSLTTVIETLGRFQDTTGQIAGAIKSIDDRLGRIHAGLNMIVGMLGGEYEGAPDMNRLEDLVYYALQRYNMVPNIELEDGEMQNAMTQVMVDVFGSAGLTVGIDAGWIADARETLEKLRDAVAEARTRLQQGGEFFQEVSAIFGDAEEIANLVAGCNIEIKTRLLSEMRGRLNEFTDTEILDEIRGAVRNKLFNSLLSVRLQSILRARLGYLDTMVNDAINFAMQSVVDAVLGWLEKNDLLNGFGNVFENLEGVLQYVKAARVNGEAVTRSDRLTELALQAEVDFAIPTPGIVGLPMTADAMIKWEERISDADTPCHGPLGEMLHEVTLKASGGSAIGLGVDSRASIGLKFAFQPNHVPAGFAGVFEIDSSEFNVNGMGMEDFSGMMALGEDSFYLSAFAAGSFGAGGTSVDLEGGFFIGQTCDTDAFAFYPHFPEQENAGPYRGVVAHLSGKAPLINGGLLNVTIGADIGGYILSVEGDGDWDPAFGGRLGGSISGEALHLLKATGSLDLGYSYEPGLHQFDGEAGVEVKLGFEPFAITRSKSFHVIYTKHVPGGSSWTVENP